MENTEQPSAEIRHSPASPRPAGAGCRSPLLPEAGCSQRHDLYPEIDAPLDMRVFRDPPPVYRGAPFWAWNCRLDKNVLSRQIEWFREMGMGGFFMHPRTGLDTEYLGAEFMDCVAACADKAAALGMKAWLYDEDRWPSGYAGGLITHDPACRERYLLLTTRPYGPRPPDLVYPMDWPVSRNERGRLLARYQISAANGVLSSYRRLLDDEPAPAGGATWYAYLEIQSPCGGWNNETLGDVLNPELTRRFIETTHERYAAAAGRHFGGTVPGIFTDEPHFSCKPALRTPPDGSKDIVLPFTDDVPPSYRRRFADDLLDRLPEVIWDLPDRSPSLTRYRFHDHLCDLLTQGFLQPIGAWCAQHGLAFTGHLVEENTLEAQTAMNGDVMRGYPHMQIPGIDIIGDGLELNAAKQTQSVVRQRGGTAMASEEYGVTGWDFTFADYKAQGDWQAALGVTLRVHHLAWVSMEGEAKRDYPASISHQQPWWKEFKLIEDHFARLTTLLTRGRPLVRIGVIHPIESFWLCYGPGEQCLREREARERQFRELTEWLLFGFMDFDFIDESLLAEQATANASSSSTILDPLGASSSHLFSTERTTRAWEGEAPAKPRSKEALTGAPFAAGTASCGAQFSVGAMRYDVILVPDLRTIRSTTLDRLERFVDAGGCLIFLGNAPVFGDAVPSDRAATLARRCRCLPMDRTVITEALRPFRLFGVQGTNSQRPASVLHQYRQEDERRYLFLCNTDREHSREGLRFEFPGTWSITHWDTLSGDIHPLPVSHEGDHTRLHVSLPAHGHLMMTLDPVQPATAVRPECPQTPSEGCHSERSEESLSPRSSRRSLATLGMTDAKTTACLTQDMDWSSLDVPYPARVPITLSEPNVFPLDLATRWRWNDEPWQPREETLRIEDAVRDRLKLPRRRSYNAQPWCIRDPVLPLGRLTLEFDIVSECGMGPSVLALERPEHWTLAWDGRAMSSADTGWWVDEAIRTIPLPAADAGTHCLRMEVEFTRKSAVEWSYLLGDFGVATRNEEVTVTAPVRELQWGDWTLQGLKFYVGDVTYRWPLELKQAAAVRVRIPSLANPVLRVALDGRDAGAIAFAPFERELGHLSAGRHELAITAFGTRNNAFGCLHHPGPDNRRPGTGHWRTTGDQWDYARHVSPKGILLPPVLEHRLKTGDGW